MNEVLLNLLKEYRSVLGSSNLSHQDKLLSIQQMSLILHNELLELFKKTIGLDIMDDYKLFIKMAENLNKNVYKNQYQVLEENNQIFITFNDKKKIFLSAKEISLSFLNTKDPDFIDLFALFISNDNDLIKFNLLF